MDESSTFLPTTAKCSQMTRTCFNIKPFNLDKTQFIVFNHNKNSSNSLCLMDSSINPIDKVKDLGRTISNNLKRNNHVKNRLEIDYSTFISFWRFLPASLNPSTKANIYKTYILSTLTYDSEVWSTSEDALNKLKIIPKRVLKCISPTATNDEGLQRFNLLHMNNLFVYRDFCLLNSILGGNCDFTTFNNRTLSIQKNERLRSATVVSFDVCKSLKSKTNECFLIRSSVVAIKLDKNTDITVLPEPKMLKVNSKNFSESQIFPFNFLHLLLSLHCLTNNN